MYIVQVASEVAPVAKVGGLADVMMGLGRELIWKGHQVDIVVPKYDCLETKSLELSVFSKGVRSFFQGAWHENSIWKAKYNGDLTLTLVESHHPSRFFERGVIYGCPDDIDRFLSFSRTVLDWLQVQEKTPDIIHVHDWETAPIAFMIRQGPFKKRFEKTRVVLTIHNIAYQGHCRVEDIEKVGFPGTWYDTTDHLRNDYNSDLNLLKGGIVFADHIVTVSPNYAKEVLTPDGGKGLQSVLLKHQSKFSGILNGIDYSYWNPEIDPLIPFKYSPEHIAAKKKNKEALRESLEMAATETKPLAISICRLVQQKGVDLIKHAILNAQKRGIQYVVLGTAPEPEIYCDFVNLAANLSHDPNVRILLVQEEALAHRLFAASDLFLMPSMFEPCGLTQLIALKYGSIPVVRHTGGLVDTVFDVDTSQKPFTETNGYAFEAPNPAGLDSALDRAVQLWQNDPARWQKLMKQAMRHDFSWNVSADKYVAIYQRELNETA